MKINQSENNALCPVVSKPQGNLSRFVQDLGRGLFITPSKIAKFRTEMALISTIDKIRCRLFTKDRLSAVAQFCAKSGFGLILNLTAIIALNNNLCYGAFEYDPEILADAIKQAENSTKYPYGIISVKCSGEAECRRICLNTIRNNYKRWLNSDKSLTYLEFLASRYAPIGVKNDPTNLNQHWLGNVRAIYERLSK